MMKTMKSIISWLLMFVLVLSMVPAKVWAADVKKENMVITVADVNVLPGSEVTIPVSVTNNVGIYSGVIQVNYDSKLSLVSSENGDAMENRKLYTQQKTDTSTVFRYEEADFNKSDIKDGVMINLRFKVSELALSGERLVVSVEIPQGNLYDQELNEIPVDLTNGSISIIGYTPGDVDGNGKIGSPDIVMLRRYITGDSNPQLNQQACNVNGDSKITLIDLILLRRYVAGGYDVELLPDDQTESCNHTLEGHDYLAPTCTEDGHIAYWYCSSCDNYFSDAEAVHMISKDDIVLNKTNHTIVILERVEPTKTTTGLTEGSICSVCNEVIVPQEVIPVISSEDDQRIVYHLNPQKDAYLATVKIQNPEDSQYVLDTGYVFGTKTDDNGDALLPSAPGYDFEGWYDSPSSNANEVKSISAGTKGPIVLYAKWVPHEYTITFGSDVKVVADMTYTANKGSTLPKPEQEGYVFVGWTDKDNQLVSRVDVGTTGDLAFHANWTSKRNYAKAVSNLDDPIVCEDPENGQILFVYEIGQIENVPLDEKDRFISAENIDSEVTYTEKTSYQKEEMSSVANTVANATTNSTAWTLSEDWNDVTTVSESWREEKGLTQSEAESIAKTENNTYSINSQKSGNTVTKTTSGDYVTTTAYGKVATEGGSENTSGINAGLSAELGAKASTETSAGFSGKILSGKVTSGYELSASIGAHLDYDNHTTTFGKTTTNSGEDTVTIDDNTTVTTKDSGWKNDNSYSNSITTSQNTTTSKQLTDIISEEKGYGHEIAKGGSHSDSAEYAFSNTKTDEYSSTVGFSTVQEKTTELKVKVRGTSQGNYRLVEAGIAHVFAVVGYDIASSSYYVYTYTLMDELTYNYVDYSSTTAQFNDNENTVLPFEVPFDIFEYVYARTAQTEGLEYDITTGTVTGYSGDSKTILIPEYISVDNMDGTRSAVQITAIAADAFAGNTNIERVYLNRFINEIPSHAFENCSSLQTIAGNRLVSIGEKAFAGCVAIEEFSVSTSVSELGENAFEGLANVTVEAANKSVLDAAILSGANSITVNVSNIADSLAGADIIVPEFVEVFELQGGRQSFTDLRIQSDAGKTILNGISIVECTGIPLVISSTELALRNVSVNSPSYVLLLSNDTSIEVYSNNSLISDNGKAIVCRNVDIFKTADAGSIACLLNVSGDIYICGTLSGDNYLKLSNGQLVHITEQEFDRYIQGTYTVTFDAAGGEVDITTKEIYSDSEIGELPVATREGFVFDGWFLEDGTMIDEHTALTSVDDITVYAHWTPIAYSANWSTEDGCKITVVRSESPFQNADLAELYSGDTVYFGDVLTITYEASEGYTLESVGSESITVSEDIVDAIYAHAVPNKYTYRIVYQSVNGTSLGESSATYEYGTSHTISAPGKNGYNTPASQNITWDSTVNKTIYFYYTPVGVGSQGLTSGTWTSWSTASGSHGLSYSAYAEIGARSSSSIQVRVVWTNTVFTPTYMNFGYAQVFSATIGGVSSGGITIASPERFYNNARNGESSTGATSWITVPADATATSTSIILLWEDGSGGKGSWSGTLSIPAY